MARWEFGDRSDNAVPASPVEYPPREPTRPRRRLRSRHAIEQAMIHHTSALKTLDGYAALCWVLGWNEIPGIDG